MADVANIKINGTTYSVKDSVARNAMGGPNVAATKAAMTDKAKVYVYTGSESGMTKGNWYYWNGSAWTSGGVYQSTGFSTDTTLTVSGMAADAKTTGDNFSDLKIALKESKFVQLIEPDFVVARTNAATTYNGDGSYTVGTTGYGRIMWGKNRAKIHLTEGLYVLFGVPSGYSFIAKEHEYSGLAVKNESPNSVLVKISEESDYYVGHRINSAPSAPFTIYPSLLKEIRTDNQSMISENIEAIKKLTHDTHDLTASVDWEVGGVAVDTGRDYDAQQNRIRTKMCFFDKELKIVPNEDFSGEHTVVLRVFTWNSYKPGSNCDAVSSEIVWPSTYTIPKNTYFRILILSRPTLSDITDVYDSILYRSIKIVDTDGSYIKESQRIPKIAYDSIENIAQLNFEAGGINNDTGKNYDPQPNRLRSSYLYTPKDLVISQNKFPVGATFVEYKVFYWENNSWPNNKTSDSGWINLPETYTIPAGSYFRICIYSSLTDEIVDVYSSALFNAFRIRSHEQDIGTVAFLNREQEPFVQALRKTYPDNAKTSFQQLYRPLTILHFSDIHRRANLWKRIVEYADQNESYIDFLLHTGDYCEADQSAYTDLYALQVPKNLVVYNCLGNHDTYITMTDGLNPDKSVAYNLLFNHTDGWNATFETNISNSMTYYKDFTESNVRLVVLDNYYNLQEQETWLSGVLSDATSRGLSVVTASHQATSTATNKIDTSFQTLIPYEAIDSGPANTVFESVIAEAITNGCKHVVHLAGHQHQDWFFRTEHGVLNCLVECATTYAGWTEGARVNGTKSMDCFNMLGIDTELGIIKIVRIGHNCDSHNRAKNVLSYDYLNDRVLYNN